MTLVFVLCYGPDMISAAAITLALAFWAPYNHGQPVCPDGVHIHNVRYGETPSSSFTFRWNDTGEVVPQCEMYANPSAAYLTTAQQCAWAVRNIGWSFMGLPPSTDRRNVMYRGGWVTPGACKA